MQTQIKQAESLSELLSLIEKIERIDINSDNFKDYLKADFRDLYERARMGAAADVLWSARMQQDFMRLMRQELFRQAVILRSRLNIPTSVPNTSDDPSADIAIWLRQWCTDAMASPTTDRGDRNRITDMNGARMNASYHFHGPVGAVQQGSTNMAHVHQTVNPAITEIMELLQVCRTELASVSDLSTRKELADLLDDFREEIQKPAPKKSKILAYLNGTTSLVTAGSALAGAIAKLYPLIEHLHHHH